MLPSQKDAYNYVPMTVGRNEFRSRRTSPAYHTLMLSGSYGNPMEAVDSFILHSTDDINVGLIIGVHLSPLKRRSRSSPVLFVGPTNLNRISAGNPHHVSPTHDRYPWCLWDSRTTSPPGALNPFEFNGSVHPHPCPAPKCRKNKHPCGAVCESVTRRTY